MKSPGLGAAIAVIGSVIALTAQQGPPDRPAFRAGVEVLPLDVTVLGADRRPVRGLTAADFRVVVDGAERRVVAFDERVVPDRVRAAARWVTEVAPDVSTNQFVPDRIIALLLNDYFTASEAWDAETVRKIGLAIIDELRPSDLVGIVYPVMSQRGVDFTTDRAKLRAAIEKFSVASISMPGGGGRGGSGMCMRNECVLDAMHGIALATRAWPDRRKLLAYLSPEGAYTIGHQKPDDLAVSESTPALMNAFRELQRANVTVYQFDPRGLSAFGPMGGGIGMFADNTGGFTVTRTNDPWLRVPEMFVENDSYYMLGIEVPFERSRSGFHPILVQVTRSDLAVRTRSGYYDPTPERKRSAAPATLTVLDRAIDGPVPLADLPLSLSAAAFRMPREIRAAVALAAGLDGPAGQADRAEVAVRAFRNGQSNGVKTFTLRLQPESTAFGLVHYDAPLRLDLPPGTYEIRLSMQREGDKIAGGVATALVVPDFGRERLSLSGVVLGRLSETAIKKDQPLAGVLPFEPTTRRAFSQGEAITALVRLYQSGRLQPVSFTTRIVNDADTAVFERTTELAPDAFEGSMRAAEHQLRLPLATLPVGAYLLTFEARLDKRLERATPVRFQVK